MLELVLGGRAAWLLVLGAFMLVGWLARSFAGRSASVPMQYFGLGLYVVAEAIIFVPLIAIAIVITGATSILMEAAILTGALFTGLTAIVFITRKDFSFLGSILTIAAIIALGLIVCGAIFGFNLGLWFSAAMILVAAGAILYDTSKILHHYPTDRHVSAALELFASVALMLWYVIRILLQARR